MQFECHVLIQAGEVTEQTKNREQNKYLFLQLVGSKTNMPITTK